MENIYPSGAAAGVVSRTAVLIVFLLLAGPLGALIPAVSGQVFPDITVECADNVEVDVSPGSSSTAVVWCELENGSMWEEEIEISVEFGDLDGTEPESVTLPAGEVVLVMFSVRAGQNAEAGNYEVNVSCLLYTSPSPRDRG